MVPEVGIGLGSGKTIYTYGNAFSATSTPVHSTNYNWVNFGGKRWALLKQNGSTFGFQHPWFYRCWIFLLLLNVIERWRRMGLWSDFYRWRRIPTVEFSGMQVLLLPGVKKTVTTKTGKSSNFNLDVDNAGGQIVLSMASNNIDTKKVRMNPSGFFFLLCSKIHFSYFHFLILSFLNLPACQTFSFLLLQ